MIKTLLIDDEPKAINVLKILLEKNFTNILQIETTASAEEGLDKIQKYDPELLFLDIEMPIMNAFDLLAKIPEKKFTIIFTTAFDQYAIKAIKFNALDYIVKPINENELKDAVNKFLSKSSKDNNHTYNKQIENFLFQKNKNLAVPTQEGVIFLELDKIIRCEAEGNYTNFVLQDGTYFLSSKTLKEYEDILVLQNNFIRVHRSHIINTHYISEYKNEGTLVLKNYSSIPVSRRRKENLFKKLNLDK